MTQLDLGTSSISAGAILQETKPAGSRRKRVTIALLLGLLSPGLGQVYVKRPARGFVAALSALVFLALAGESRFFLTFPGLVSSLLASVLLRLWIIGDACYLAWKSVSVELRSRKSRISSALAVVLILLVSVYPVPDVWLKYCAHFRAYKISSGSMCPTLCEDDRMVVSTAAYRNRAPGRGELVIFDFKQTGQMFPKRVAGVPGDRVARGPANTILVNGNALKIPAPCGKTAAPESLAPEGPDFEPVKVPDGSLFVIGDNLDNSYDSRFFGFVPLDQVRGKPVFLYWSPERSRIGCELR